MTDSGAPRYPTALRPGDQVAVIAPAGPVRDRDALDRGVARLQAAGFAPRLATHLLACDGYLAGADADRTADLQAALDDPDIRAILCARGGYGAIRIVEHIDWSSARRDPKPLLGYSDITVLLAAQWAEAGVIGFHGPMVARPAAHALDDACARMQHELLTKTDGATTVPAVRAPDTVHLLRPGSARGRLVGGNLALVMTLLGTPWQIDTTDAIFFLEDIDEPPYRVDRMLSQLRLAGAFDACRAIVLGDFAPPSGDETQREAIHAVIDERLRGLDVPISRGWPFGHRANSWTLPFGLEAEVVAEPGRASLRFDRSATR